MNEPTYEPYTGPDTIKFDYDAVQEAYTLMKEIYSQAEEIKNNLEESSKTAQEKMKGQYKKAYKENSEKIFKDLKSNIKAIKTLSDDMEAVSKGFLKVEMVAKEACES